MLYNFLVKINQIRFKFFEKNGHFVFRQGVQFHKPDFTKKSPEDP